MRGFEGARRILLSPATSLSGLANVVGLSAEELFAGVNFANVDLRDEPVDLLVRIDADFTDAILTHQQRAALKAAPARLHRIQSTIYDVLAAILHRFVDNTFRREQRTSAIDTLVAPLLDRGGSGDERNRAKTRFGQAAVKFVTDDPSGLNGSLADALKSLLDTLKRARLPITRELLRAWPMESQEAASLLRPDRLRDLIDLDFCTAEFVTAWIDSFDGGVRQKPLWRLEPSAELPEWQEDRAIGAAEEPDLYREALKVAIDGPSRPPPDYLTAILRRARSGEELRDLVGSIPLSALDQTGVATIARTLAQGARTRQSIALTLSDQGLHPRVLGAFRRLLIAVDRPETRRALLETIVDLGERASGLEVDAVVASLSFGETLRELRPFWQHLAPHHQNIARAALREKAASPEEREQAERFGR